MVDYDTIIIGSGAGGMSAAVALAQAGQKVLVCEQHEVPGGWCHSFALDGYRFNTGVHYVGELGPGHRLREIYEGLGVSQELTFLELHPEGYDHIYIGEDKFDIPRGKQTFIARLGDRFPQEKRGINRLFTKTEDIFWALNKMLDEEWAAVLRRPKVLPWFARSGSTLVNHYVQDPLLRAILAAQSGAHGLPPSQVSAAIHSGIVHHYLEGAYHPFGGGQSIARAFVRALKREGGELRLKTPVKSITLAGRRAAGVLLANGDRISANHIISNADPRITFLSLIGREQLSRRTRWNIQRLAYSTSCVTLYLAVSCDLRSMGLDSGNYWLYEHSDLESIYRLGLTDHVAYHRPPVLFVTATTLKDPIKLNRGHHQLEVFAFVNYDAFKRWENQPTGARDSTYKALKSQISDRMLQALDVRFPGIKDAVVFQALGTPLTNKHYINAHRGNIYGVEKSVWQAGPLAYRPDTEFKNLFLCGASTMAHGIAYATISGLTAAGRVLKCRARDLLHRGGPPLQILPCDHVNEWPREMRQRLNSKYQSVSHVSS